MSPDEIFAMSPNHIFTVSRNERKRVGLLTHSFPMHPSLRPLKTSENRKVFLCFQGVEEKCIGNK